MEAQASLEGAGGSVRVSAEGSGGWPGSPGRERRALAGRSGRGRRAGHRWHHARPAAIAAPGLAMPVRRERHAHPAASGREAQVREAHIRASSLCTIAVPASAMTSRTHPASADATTSRRNCCSAESRSASGSTHGTAISVSITSSVTPGPGPPHRPTPWRPRRTGPRSPWPSRSPWSALLGATARPGTPPQGPAGTAPTPPPAGPPPQRRSRPRPPELAHIRRERQVRDRHARPTSAVTVTSRPEPGGRWQPGAFFWGRTEVQPAHYHSKRALPM